MVFYDKVNEQLKLQKRTRKQMCEEANISYSSVTSMFNRKSRSIDMDTMEAIAKYLNVSMDYLILADVDDPDYGKPAQSVRDSTKKLPIDEGRLINSYRKLNATGQKKALDAIEDLTEIPKYKKSANDKRVELSEELA